MVSKRAINEKFCHNLDYSGYIIHYMGTYGDNHALLIFTIKVYEFQNQVSSGPK